MRYPTLVMAGDSITTGKVVRLKYTMKGEKGNVLDESADAEAYVHGAGKIVPGLEQALEGKRAGDVFSVTIKPDQGFGRRRRGPGPQSVPRSTFPEDALLKPGVTFSAETRTGEPVTLFITRVEKDAVYVDINHPFAGMTLRYDVEVVSVRDATAKEKRDGVPSEK